MLVLYGGDYWGPGSSSLGCYLIYDAAVSGGSNLMSTVPPLPLPPRLTCIGAGAVALRSHPLSSSFVLAELATTPQRRLPDAELYLWHSESPTPQWEMKAVRLPPEVRSAPGKHNFSIDTSFSFGTSSLCWIDLLRGMVVYNLDQQDPHQFRFIPLPDGCPEFSNDDYPYRPCMNEFRTAACVVGTIKLFALEGDLKNFWDSHQFKYVIWTLMPDLGQWKKDAEFKRSDIWASDKYLALKIPQHGPVCPVLSPLDGVVFVIVNDVEVDNIYHGLEVVQTKFNIKGQYVLSLDVQSNKIISTAGPASNDVHLMPRLLATEFPAYLQGAKDCQRDRKVSKVGDSGKEAEGLLISATYHAKDEALSDDCNSSCRINGRFE